MIFSISFVKILVFARRARQEGELEESASHHVWENGGAQKKNQATPPDSSLDLIFAENESLQCVSKFETPPLTKNIGGGVRSTLLQPPFESFFVRHVQTDVAV